MFEHGGYAGRRNLAILLYLVDIGLPIYMDVDVLSLCHTFDVRERAKVLVCVLHVGG